MDPQAPQFVRAGDTLTLNLPPTLLQAISQARASQDLSQPPAFVPYNYSFNARFKAIICNTCRSIVPRDSALHHSGSCDGTFARNQRATNYEAEATDAHSTSKRPNPRKPTSSDDQLLLAAINDLQCLAGISDFEPVRVIADTETLYVPIAGVRIIKNFHGCSCGGGTVPTPEAWRKHRDKAGEHSLRRDCWIQRPFNNANATYYRVVPVQPDKGTLSDAELLGIAFAQRTQVFDPAVNTSIGLRYNSLFTHFSGLDTWAQQNKITRSLLSALHHRTLAPCKKDKVLGLVREQVYQYVIDITKRFDGSDRLIRREIQAGRYAVVLEPQYETVLTPSDCSPAE